MNKLPLLLLPLFVLLACKPEPPSPAREETPTGRQSPTVPEGVPTVYVSPTGRDANEGSREAPLATVKAAAAKLDAAGGVIILRQGTYREKISLPASADEVAPLQLMAEPGEKVVFEGGVQITDGKEDAAYPGMYVIHAPGRQTIRNAAEYFEVWENGERVRYRKAADPAGVMAWPGSVCALDGDQLLVHVRDGRTPAEADLWRNQKAEGAHIERSNVTLVGLVFQNYLGGAEARALTTTKGKNIRILHGRFINNIMGISNSARDTLIEDCFFDEAGIGIRHAGTGTDMIARRCVIGSATGLFAFSDLGEHMRDGIRIYHAGNGATIEQCVTAGFWAGLYIKTVSHRDGSHPFYVRNNTLIDGIRGGADHKQPRTFVRRNIIGPSVNATGVGPNGSYLRDMGATLEENYYFGHKGKAVGNDSNGPEPFVDLAAGDLHLRPSLPLPVPADELGATEIRQVHWNARLAAALKPQKTTVVALAITQPPVVAASREGALVSIALSRPDIPTLFYRLPGAPEWQTLKGLPNQVMRPVGMAASAPVEPEIIESWSFLFVLLNGTLQPERTYEFRIEAGQGAEKFKTPPATFSTQGGAKSLYVAVETGGKKSDGTQAAPFSRIQDALDRALPGDTVVIGPGIYTEPLLLQHGGTPEHPLTIQGSGMRETILDGGKQAGTIMALQKAPHVHLAGMQVRWFGNIGVHAKDSPAGTAEALWIWNRSLAPKSEGISGLALLIEDSPDWNVSRSIFNRTEHGILAVRSPRIHIRHNTAFGNIYSGIALINSSAGSEVTHNTLNFTGNVSYRVDETDPQAFASLISDYNNFGTHLWLVKEIDQGGTIRKVEGIRPENDFTPAKHYGPMVGSKFMIEARIAKGSDVFLRMADWRKFSGKDEHSIYADPLFVNPTGGDFHLRPASPNLLPDGQVIGAENIQEPTS